MWPQAGRSGTSGSARHFERCCRLILGIPDGRAITWLHTIEEIHKDYPPIQIFQRLVGNRVKYPTMQIAGLYGPRGSRTRGSIPECSRLNDFGGTQSFEGDTGCCLEASRVGTNAVSWLLLNSDESSADNRCRRHKLAASCGGSMAS